MLWTLIRCILILIKNEVWYFLGLRNKDGYYYQKTTYVRLAKSVLKAWFAPKNQNYAAQTYNTLLTDVKDHKTDFVPITSSPHIEKADETRLLAYYLPQFHSIPLNDKYFGRGFTEWTNVCSSMPLFPGHHQPQIPYDVGFYDLSHPDVMYRQVELAKMYGIYGFCFYYYWFSGKKLLEKPLYNWLNHKDLDRHFCLFWANEPWSKNWDGGDLQVIMPWEVRPNDEELFLNDFLPFAQDDRYIKIDNKPLLIVYKPWKMSRERFIAYFDYVRTGLIQHGFNGLYLMGVENKLCDHENDWSLDGFIEFPPSNMYSAADVEDIPIAAKGACATIFSMERYIREKQYLFDCNYKLFRGLFATWDNSARKAFSDGAIYGGITYELYQVWLKDLIQYTQQHNTPQEQYVFINAWNEWAEGAHLEPDCRYGYKWLQATKDALESMNK